MARGLRYVSDRAVRYGMIVMDDAAPTLLRVRGQPMFFRSADETIEYAQLHSINRWMVYGDPEGWWPLYTQAGAVNPAPLPKERVHIRLHTSVSLKKEWQRRATGINQDPPKPSPPTN